MRPSVKANLENVSPEPKTLQDRLIDTGSFDNVSKRSVERLHHPHEPQYQRHFVKKPLRRSPLLNRFYWIRLKAVEHVISSFLSNSSNDVPKTIINLGCGHDTLPWRLNYRNSEACQSTRFIDVDLAPLMTQKQKIVTATPQLAELLGVGFQLNETDSDHLLLSSKRYCQVVCDLRDISALKNALLPLVTPGSKVLFLAEMSLSYQDDESTGALLTWARQIQADFCLLDYCLPAGTHHPLAARLLQDYDKAQAPLLSLRSYGGQEDQCARFRCSGWVNVKSWDLWNVWSREEFVTDAERDTLNAVESLDEWEDLILLSRHVFILHASIEVLGESSTLGSRETAPSNAPEKHLKATPLKQPKVPKRKLGAALVARTPEGREFQLNIMGLGSNGLSDSYDVLAIGKGESMLKLPTTGPKPRLWFTLTDLGEIGTLLVGGKSQLSNGPLGDCWLFSRGSRPRWTKTWDLPRGLYKQSAVRLGQTSMLLILGGRTAQGISTDPLVFHPDKGWQTCNMMSPLHQPVFSSAAWCITECGKNSSTGSYQGVLCGGLLASGAPSLNVYRWFADLTSHQPALRYELLRADSDNLASLAVVGPSTVTKGSKVYLCGGIGSKSDINCLGQSIVRVIMDEEDRVVLSLSTPSGLNCSRWPLMLGSSVTVHPDHLLVAGGGTTTFAGGSLWNEALHTIKISQSSQGLDQILSHMELLEVPRINSAASDLDRDPSGPGEPPQMITIPRMRLASTEDFRTILEKRKPVIIEGLDFGACLTDWTPEYLTTQVGPQTEVIVHECINDSPRLDFNAKNFKYVTERFGKVIPKMQQGARMYLRSLSRSKPSDIPANIQDDFPTLAPDFTLPMQLDLARASLFSSILRLSGRANMWLHYDVMANIYTQIRGRKQMILFPPRDATKLSFAPGASSSSFDVFSALGTGELAGTQPHEAILDEGDALFLPAAWLHTATPLTDMSVAVNVFFRDLVGGYADGRDVYGNRDLAAYEKGRQEAAKIARGFRHVPQDMRQFYLSRIADELLQLADNPQ